MRFLVVIIIVTGVRMPPCIAKARMVRSHHQARYMHVFLLFGLALTQKVDLGDKNEQENAARRRKDNGQRHEKQSVLTLTGQENHGKTHDTHEHDRHDRFEQVLTLGIFQAVTKSSKKKK